MQTPHHVWCVSCAGCITAPVCLFNLHWRIRCSCCFGSEERAAGSGDEAYGAVDPGGMSRTLLSKLHEAIFSVRLLTGITCLLWESSLRSTTSWSFASLKILDAPAAEAFFLVAPTSFLAVAAGANCCLEEDVAVLLLTWISSALVGLMALGSPNSSVDQMGALTAHVDEQSRDLVHGEEWMRLYLF